MRSPGRSHYTGSQHKKRDLKTGIRPGTLVACGGSGLYESHLDIWKFLNTAGPYRVMGSVLGFYRDGSETYSYYHTLLTKQLSSTGNACFFRHSATSEALVAAVPKGSM